MTIINVNDNNGTLMMPSFMINYTEDENKLLHKLYDKYHKGWYIEDPLGADQCMVILYDRLPWHAKKKLKVDEISISAINYKNGAWKLLCDPDLYPAKYYTNPECPFIDTVYWRDCKDGMPENILGTIKCMNETGGSCIDNCMDGIFEKTDKVLVWLNNGETYLDRRVNIDNVWQWQNHNEDDVIKWMKIPR